MAYRFDEDLEFLRSMKSEDLNALVEILTGKEGETRFTEELTTNPLYKRFYPEHIEYIEYVMAELQCYGANSLATIFRGGKGVLYKEILCNVCDKAKVNYNKNSSVELIEQNLLLKVLTDSLEKTDMNELKELSKDIGVTITDFTKQGVTAAIQAAIKAGGFKFYQLALIVANAVAKSVLGSGLSLATNATLTRAMGIFTGPIGWVLTGAWTFVDIAGAAYRVTTPAVIQVAFLRQLKAQRDNHQ